MTKTFRMLMLTGALAGAFAVSTGAAAKEITVALASTFTTMDPYDAGDTLSQNSAKSMYEGLFGLDKDMKLKNALATGYEVSKDGLVYTVTLRKGVMFHDGTEFKADAVKANFDRVTNKDNALRRYTLYMNIAKTEVVDDYTVRITLHTPFSAFINQLAHPAGVMICPKSLEKYPGKQIAFHPCGTGPYILKDYNPSEILHVVLLKKPEDAKLNMLYAGWSSSTGELDWALRPLLATASWAPVAGNYGFYSSKVLDDSFTKALLTTDRAEKTKLYNAGQDAIWNDAPWIFLINEQNVSAKVKNLKKFYVQPDAGFDYYEAELD